MIIEKMLESEEFLKELDERISVGENWNKDLILKKSKELIEPGDIKLLDVIITENLDHEPIFINLYKTFIKIKDNSVKHNIYRTYYFFMID